MGPSYCSDGKRQGVSCGDNFISPPPEISEGARHICARKERTNRPHAPDHQRGTVDRADDDPAAVTAEPCEFCYEGRKIFDILEDLGAIHKVELLVCKWKFDDVGVQRRDSLGLG